MNKLINDNFLFTLFNYNYFMLLAFPIEKEKMLALSLPKQEFLQEDAALKLNLRNQEYS